MNRELKFRCWSEKEKAYLDGPGRFLWVSHDDTTSGLYSPTDLQITLEQYTGLKDKNGKEIYEGDIAREFGLGNYLVEFREGCWKIGKDWLYVVSPHYIEVIGNIHENPELLGGEE